MTKMKFGDKIKYEPKLVIIFRTSAIFAGFFAFSAG
jgi:hypothetical protein